MDYTNEGLFLLFTKVGQINLERKRNCIHFIYDLQWFSDPIWIFHSGQYLSLEVLLRNYGHFFQISLPRIQWLLAVSCAAAKGLFTQQPNSFSCERSHSSCFDKPEDGIVISVKLVTARKRSLGQGNVFTPVCDSVHRGGGVCPIACWDTPLADSPGQTPHIGSDLQADTAPRQTTPSFGYYKIRSTNGQYASYWNAFL